MEEVCTKGWGGRRREGWRKVEGDGDENVVMVDNVVNSGV